MPSTEIGADRSSAAERSNLPAHRPPLIGRDEQAAAVGQRLMEAEAGLLTLIGAGGCGKTCLAVDVAGRLLDAFPDGVWLVEFAALSDPALVDQVVAAVLGVREGVGQSLRDALLGFLRPRRLLLLLDNCEHLVDACARLTDVLLGFCAELRILATSREPLRTIREVTWRVPSLAAPDPERIMRLDELAEYAAVHLFVTRAQAVRSSFELRSDNAAAVARVCAQLEGIPLALELAAARTRALAVEQIAARLAEDFRLLVGGNPTGPSRQRTLEATLDWSHDLLTETEQMLFRRLSVFAGGFDLEAAEVVCGGDGVVRAEVLDVLTRLVDKSLVVVEERSGDARYRLLEPIRQYAQERLLVSGETEAMRGRHSAHYRALAELAEPELWGRRQGLWLGRLERDHDNLRAALGWLLEGAEEAEAGRRFAVALSRFWHTRGDLSEGQGWIKRALATPAGAATRGWATALTWASTFAHHQGDLDEAKVLGERAVLVSRELGDPVILGLALVTLGDELVRPGHLDRAIAALEEGVAILRAEGDRAAASLSAGLGVLGSALRMRGDLDHAVAVLEEGLALSRSVGNSWAVGIALQDLAQMALERGEEQRAAALFTECVGVAREIADSRRLAECLEGFGELAVQAGLVERGARLLGAAQALRDSNGSVAEPVDRPILARSVAAARQALGEAAFSTAWDSGRAGPLERALDDALTPSGLASARRQRPTHSTSAGPLTAREWEIVKLIAHGLTNPQIAEQLVISRRTADRHVSNILNKLGFTTRAQVAAWAVERGMSAVPD